jgi:GT2 family glycosyltransferase
MKCTIVLLNWNNADDTLECLHSLKQLRSPCEILIVDNGSTDNSVERIREFDPHLLLIETGKNLGYAGGNNRGIEVALSHGAELILLLNNDTVVAPNLLDVFSKTALDHPKAGAFGAKIYFYDDPITLWYAGGDVDLLTLRCFHEGCGKADLYGEYRDVRQTGYACGCAIAVRAEAIRQVGLLHADFFLLWEEIDWCWRLRRADWECLFVPDAKVWHKVSASFPSGNRGPFWQYHYFRSRLIFLRRNFPLRERLQFYLRVVLWEIMDLLLVSFRPYISSDLRLKSRAALKGIFSYFVRKLVLGSFFWF